MPFKSEKQRKYLWANEPEIARDWSDKYGSRVKKQGGGITRIPFANGSTPWNPYRNFTRSGGLPFVRGYKDDMLEQYRNIAAQSEGDLNRANLTYEDSPIFNRGYEAWDPSSIGSNIIRNISIPKSNLPTWAMGRGDEGLLGAASIHSMPMGIEKLTFGDKTSAAFKRSLLEPIISGTATPEQKQKFAGVFGHEMSHLGWPYKPRDELINVPGVGKEQGFAGSLKAGMGGYGAGEEVWNYMHDLMYSPRGYSKEKFDSDVKNVKDQFASGKINPEQHRSQLSALIKKLEASSTGENAGEGYLKSGNYINLGDKSYTPKAHEALAWSGLTSEGKRAIGFGVNPHEDTMMGRMRSYPNKLSDEAWLAEADKRHLTASNPNVMKDFRYSTNATPFKYDDTDDDKKALSYAIKKSIPKKLALRKRMMNFLRGRGTRLTPAQQANQNFITQQRININPQGRMTSGPFVGQHAPGTSFFGSKTPQEMALKNLQRWGKTAPTSKIKTWENIATGGNKAPSVGQQTSGRSDESWKNDPFAKGGLATLWRR